MFIDFNRLQKAVKRHEGFRSLPYKDSVGKTTIGYGWNLDDKGITKEIADSILKDQLNDCIFELLKVNDFRLLTDQPRREVLINMSFNLGLTKLMKFKKMWYAIRCRAWEVAADEMLDSLWAKQVGKRAIELSEIMRSGEI